MEVDKRFKKSWKRVSQNGLLSRLLEDCKMISHLETSGGPEKKNNRYINTYYRKKQVIKTYIMMMLRMVLHDTAFTCFRILLDQF